MNQPAATNIDEYIAAFPPAVRKQLQAIRRIVRKAAPEAQEKISYRIPTFALRGNLVHFAAFKSHVGFYPGASGIAAFADELRPFPTSKGTVQFALGVALPLTLIERIVRFRVVENLRA